MRIGQGIDIHAFDDGDHVVLGGVRIPHDRGILAHSDGDVVLHALCDALLGALALGDIGRHFPPSEARWKDADSRQFLRHCAMLVRERGHVVGNVDVTVVCERPRIGPHADAMRAHIAADLGCTVEQVSVKATTSERLGFTGRREGIAAFAVALLVEAKATALESTAAATTPREVAESVLEADDNAIGAAVIDAATHGEDPAHNPDATGAKPKPVQRP